MSRYRVAIGTAKPTASGDLSPTLPRVYRVETDAGAHAAVALAVARHLRERESWPVNAVSVSRSGRFGWLGAEPISPADAAPTTGPSRRFRVAFDDRAYTVATWLGEFKAAAIATEEYLRAGGAAALERIAVESLGPGPRFGERRDREAVDFQYEWRI